MKIVEMLEHSNEASGTYVCDDGTHIIWVEGRSSDMDVLRPDGTRLQVGVFEPSVWVDLTTEADECGVPRRPMTGVEEIYHEAVRGSAVRLGG